MRRNEFGRSMVEMLGVLAIVGVLSVGGISSYTTAMQKHKANEIIHVASMLYTLSGSGDCVELSHTSLPKNPAGISINMTADASVVGSKPVVNIQINDANSEKICNIIQSMTQNNAAFDIDSCSNISVSCVNE